MWWLAVAPTTTTTVTSLLLRRFNTTKSCRALLLIHHTTTTTTSKFGTFILHQAANLHTTTTTSNSSSSKFGTFILQTINFEKNKNEACIKLYKLSSGSDGDHGEDGNKDEDDDDHHKKKMVFKLDDLGFSPFFKDYLLPTSLGMVGSCNGIICLHDPQAMDVDLNTDTTIQHSTNLRDVCLWNPATTQFRILPKSIPIEFGPTQDHGSYVEDFVAFGFDVKNNDYKVFRITSFIQKEDRDVEGCMCYVQVYSLSSDSWRLLEGINSLPVIPNQEMHQNNHGIYLNGSYFFLGRKNEYMYKKSDDLMMLSFDFTKEIFTTMQLPENPNSLNTVLSCTGDKLAVFTRPRNDNRYNNGIPGYDDSDGTVYEYYDIWVLNEQQHGSSSSSSSSESWTKLHSFPIKRRLYSHSQPRCISNNGEFALISSSTTTDHWNQKLELFNLVTKEVEKDFLLIGNHMCRADVYKESLVSIMGGGNVLLRWQLPTHGTTYKLNLDADVDEYGFVLGIGLCLISDTGGCIGVRSLKRYMNIDTEVSSAQEEGAQAMLQAIKWAIKLELSPIIIESEFKNVVSFFMEEDDDDDDNNSTYWSSEALSLLREAKLLLNSSEIGIGISFKYCSKSCNYVADIAAKLGREGDWYCKEWTANSPGEIVSSLSKDLGLITEETYRDWWFSQ